MTVIEVKRADKVKLNSNFAKSPVDWGCWLVSSHMVQLFLKHLPSSNTSKIQSVRKIFSRHQSHVGKTKLKTNNTKTFEAFFLTPTQSFHIE